MPQAHQVVYSFLGGPDIIGQHRVLLSVRRHGVGVHDGQIRLDQLLGIGVHKGSCEDNSIHLAPHQHVDIRLLSFQFVPAVADQGAVTAGKGILLNGLQHGRQEGSVNVVCDYPNAVGLFRFQAAGYSVGLEIELLGCF